MATNYSYTLSLIDKISPQLKQISEWVSQFKVAEYLLNYSCRLIGRMMGGGC